MTTNVYPTTSMPSVAGMPGIRFRHFRGLDIDVPGMAAANQAARLADGEVEPIDEGASSADPSAVGSDAGAPVTIR